MHSSHCSSSSSAPPDAAAFGWFIGAGLRAVDQDGAQALVLGCAGMSAARDEVAARVPLTVVDGVVEATRLVEQLTP